MSFTKTATAWMGKNLRVAEFFSSNVGKSYARWMAVGAGVGAFRGMADNVVGQDRVSVIGGAVQGALSFGALRGIGHLWRIGTRGPMAAAGMNRAAPKLLGTTYGVPMGGGVGPIYTGPARPGAGPKFGGYLPYIPGKGAARRARGVR